MFIKEMHKFWVSEKKMFSLDYNIFSQEIRFLLDYA